MLQTRIEAERGPYYSPYGKPSGPAGLRSPDASAPAAKGMTGKLAPDDPMMQYIQDAAYRTFLYEDEDFDPERVSKVPLRLDEKSQRMLAKNGITDPSFFVYDRRTQDHRPITIHGSWDELGKFSLS